VAVDFTKYSAKQKKKKETSSYFQMIFSSQFLCVNIDLIGRFNN